MIRLRRMGIALALVGAAAPAMAQEVAPAAAAEAPADAVLTARQIMERVDHINDGDDERNTLDMTLTNRRGQTRQRAMLGWNKRTGPDQENQLVRFEEPADVKGVGLLTWEHDDRDDDQWLYLPALRKVRRISSADQSDSFMGTDFSFEDMRSEKLEEHTYTLQREESLGDRLCWVIEAVPSTDKQKNESGYSRRVLWVDQATHLLIKGEFYDKKGNLLKTLETRDYEEVAGGLWRVNWMLMQNVQKKHQTLLVFTGREVNTGLDDSLFTERYLKRGR